MIYKQYQICKETFRTTIPPSCILVIIPTEGKTERELAEAGLQALKDWMLEIGMPLTISELGATADMIPGITETTVVYPAGYLDLTKEDLTEILKESM